MKYSLGLDIGSVNIKLSLLTHDGSCVRLDVEKVTTSSRNAVNTLLSRLSEEIDFKDITSVGVTGTGSKLIPSDWRWGEYGTALSVATGLLKDYPDPHTIIQIGGQSSLIIELNEGLKNPWKVYTNPLCAAGTGKFIEQQAYRLGISLDEFTRIALSYKDKAPRIAARCSVFAKSDIIHLQQKGAPLSAMLCALCESIARMVVSMKKGDFETLVFFVGGMAANDAVVRSLQNVISEHNGSPCNITIPENYLHTAAIGAALLSRNKKAAEVSLLPEDEKSNNYTQLSPLAQKTESKNPTDNEITQTCSAYLGVDIGSTSTKAVLIDEKGAVIARNYLMTSGKPLDAIKEVFRNLIRNGAEKLNISGVGITGSGRYLVGEFIGADLIKNEITAQTRAATEIDPDADIIEIGGQDSKLVLKRKGIVVDYQMNKACAAGTGSFIDELAELLGVNVKDGSFARLAFNAPYTIDLGTRCAAFLGQSVSSAQRDGVPLEVIVASLSNSIARNYLTKVVANRKLGKKVILTGAVFYNDAVVAAFRQQLPEHDLAVAEYKEVTGAIGAALLAKEENKGSSNFKGFRQVIDSTYTVSTFVCNGCENNCTITRMQTGAQHAAFYGSRCDKYDAAKSSEKQHTQFDERKKILLHEYKKPSGSKIKVGIPRSLLVYDYAPMLLGYLDALGVEAVLSEPTDSGIIKNAVEISYSDSCFPLKLLHGHVNALKDKVDYILYPCFVSLGEKEGEENQKYSCPVVQTSPFIVRHVMGLGDKLLAPVIDMRQGTKELISNFSETALKLGFSRQKGRRAILAGLKAQEHYEAERATIGKKLLEKLRKEHKIGIVIFGRAYMAQDSGANLGIAEKLAQLGVTAIPLDFLPLDSVDIKKYSDRPYWAYEGKFIAAADIVARNPQLYGLALTNFGCGPNSFILNLVEDIMGGKPLGQVEIDEHAAEAGLVTRLEAFVDTITSLDKSKQKFTVSQKDISRFTGAFVSSEKTMVLPRMSPHIEVLAACINAFGGRAIILPDPDEDNLLLSNQLTSGAECLPFRVTLGDFLKFCRDNGSDLHKYEGLMAGAYGPCRLGKYAGEHNRALQEYGYDMPVRSSVSNNGYRDMGIDPAFTAYAIRYNLITDVLERLLWRTRPYEKIKGTSDALFREQIDKMLGGIQRREAPNGFLRKASSEFKALVDHHLPKRPLIGINGEVYLRTNRFSNRDLVRVCENAGLEVIVSPLAEWLQYVTVRHLEDAVKNRQPGKTVKRLINKLAVEYEYKLLTASVRPAFSVREGSIASLIQKSEEYLSSRCGGEAILSLGAGIEWMENKKFAGAISVMPHGCMPGGIVAAMSEKFSSYHGKPWISLTFDGFPETSNISKVHEFAEIIKFKTNPSNKDKSH